MTAWGAGWLKFSSRGADPQYSRHAGSDPALLLTVISGATRHMPVTSAAFEPTSGFQATGGPAHPTLSQLTRASP